MQLPSYQRQFNKITEAYIKGEIKPFDINFCFCGTLAGGSNWAYDFGQPSPYTYKEYGSMERALFSTFPNVVYNGIADTVGTRESAVVNSPYYETRLFKGMCKALDVLKQIHIERGEVIDEAPIFKPRQLA